MLVQWNWERFIEFLPKSCKNREEVQRNMWPLFCLTRETRKKYKFPEANTSKFHVSYLHAKKIFWKYWDLKKK